MPEDRVADAEDPALEERLQDIEDDLTAKIADVRQRIVQIKMEIDEKAPAEHDHAALEEQLDHLEAEVEAIEPGDPDAVAALESAVDDHAAALDGLDEDIADLREKVGMLASSSVDVQDRLDELEERLEDTTATFDGIEDKLDMVASSSVDVQDRLAALDERARERDALGRLRRAANRAQVRRARCGACETRLDVSLLDAPACPDCEATFVDVEAGGLLRRGRLVTGAPGESPDTDPSADTPIGPDGPADRSA